MHCLAWIDGAPTLKADGSNEEEVRNFIDRYITCRIPGEDEGALRDLVLQCQVHNCTDSCKRRGRFKGKFTEDNCRYSFPFNPCAKTKIHNIAKVVKSKKFSRVPKRLYELRRGTDEAKINPYNPAMLAAWGANCDIQFISENSWILSRYVTGYVSKGEKGYSEGLWKAIETHNLAEDPSLRKGIYKCLAECLRNKETGAYESVAQLLRIPYCKFSRGDIPFYLNTLPPNLRSRALRKQKVIQNLEEGSTDIYCKNFVTDHYPNRPQQWEALSLFEVFLSS